MGTKTIMKFVGTWKSITEKEAKTIKIEIIKMRKGTRLDELKKKY